MTRRDGRTMLTDLSGSGDNVLVVATVTHETDLDTHRPYQKGLLYDGSLSQEEVRPFVVYDPDLRLKVGQRYCLNGKDHYYEPREEIQLMLSKNPYAEEQPHPDY